MNEFIVWLILFGLCSIGTLITGNKAKNSWDKTHNKTNASDNYGVSQAGEGNVALVGVKDSTITITPPNPAPTHVPAQAATAVYVELQMVDFPIIIPPHSSVLTVPINRKRMETVKWGFAEQVNAGNTETQWPSQHIMARLGNLPPMAWRCDVSNHGTTNVLDVSISMAINLGNERPPIAYTAIVTPLPAGETRSFYLINDCKLAVTVILPDDVTLQVLGEPERRQVPLLKRNKNPIDSIAMLFGAEVGLFGGEPSE